MDTTTDKLKLLLATCKAGVSIEVNDHRNVYESVRQRIEDEATWGTPPTIEDAVRAKMIETDTIVAIQFYPRTPITFYRIWHYDLDAALDQALDCLRDEGLLT